MEQLYHIIDTFFAPGILIGLSVYLFFLYIPPRVALRSYRVARYVMGAAYLVYALCIYLEHNILSDAEGKALARPIILTVACFQAYLFTYTLINLISLNYLKLRNLLIELAIIIAITVTFFSIHIIYPGTGSMWAFVTFALVYIALLARYVLLFNREYKHYTSLMDNYYSDDETRRLQWVKRSFYISLAVGVMALLYALMPTEAVGLVFISIVIVFYVVFGVRFINYALHFDFIESAITTDDADHEESTEVDNELMRRIDELMESKKLFRKSDLSVNDIARKLNERPRAVSAAINACRGTNFKTYINEFRVEESKRLINEDKSNNRTIDAIASEAGFTNRSSFYRVFKRSQGVSPTDYRMGVTRKD